jgi:Zn-dependent protease with chaperone function
MGQGAGRVSAVVVVCLLSAGGAARGQQPAAGDDALEAEIRGEVAAASGEAAALFDQANQARGARELARAVELYQKASELAPAVDHPIRRRCTLLSELGRHDEAVDGCQRAVALAPDSPLDQSALAMALANRGGPGDADRALPLARKAAKARWQDVRVVATWCGAALEAQNSPDLQECAPRLLELDPEGAIANYVSALAKAEQGDFTSARRFLAYARKAGIDDETYRGLSAAFDRAEAAGTSDGPDLAVLLPAVWVGAGWLGGLLLLLAAGWVLSRLTLRAANRVAASGGTAAQGSEGERRLRRIYRVVILVSGLWFYLSVPLLLLSIVVAGGALIWLFFSMGTIPIKAVLAIGLVVVVTIGAVLRSLVVRGEQAELGYKIDLDGNPRFRDLLREVAAAVATRPVDGAYLTPATDMAVTERGSLWKAVSAQSRERCLIIGVGLLDGMKEIELRSVLAHEYGHFRNQDTAGGGFALAVRRSLVTMIVQLAGSGAATWYNPAWWMLRLYHRVYLVVTQGASRLQEVLADRWAVAAYGSDAFVRGFTHVMERSVRFERHVDATLHEVIEGEHPLPNLYSYRPAAGEPADEQAAIDAALAREPSAYDSHPAPRQRLAWAAALAVAREPEPDDERPVWELFADRAALEARMTAEVREAVAANHGVAIGG